ncbi:MAG: hypothetical protein MNPFHGCM_01795 [Gemmatimonadaceae bacterium]|nr:hypothetical protein [Gemmatimonadaceae bacterium]
MSALDANFFGNAIRTWFVAGAVFAVVGGILLLGKRLLTNRLAAVAARTATEIDDVAVDLLRRTRLYFIAVIALVAALQVLDLSERLREVVRWLSIVVLLLQVGVWSNGLIAYWLRQWAEKQGQDRANATTIAAFGALARFVLWLVLCLVALQNLGINVTTLITGLGITGVAVALAVQNILGDLFAALSIVVDKPFIVGDTIAVDAVTGTVERIGLKATRVRSLSGELVIFSNADLLRSRVRNITSLLERRVVFTMGITFDTPPDALARIPDLIRNIIAETPNLRFDRSHFTRIGESALEFETVYWVTSPDYLVYKDAEQQVNLGILRRFGQESLSFAFPTRTVVVTSGSSSTLASAPGAATVKPSPRSASA